MKRLPGLAIAAGVALAFSLNVQAQDCTIGNWQVDGTATATNLTNGDVGSTNPFRRYAGPCGLLVAVDGTNRFLTDGSPSAETVYNARFFTYLNDAGSNPILLFAADDGDDDQIQVWYNFPSAGNLTLRVFDNSAQANDLTESVGSGWHSVEFAWDSVAETVAFSVNNAPDLTLTPSIAGLTIANAHLGNIEGANGGAGAAISFDDFESRRQSRPPRLCRGLTVPEGTGPGERDRLALADARAVFAEVASFGAERAGGQPDFNGDGVVALADAREIFSNVAAFQTDCDLHR